MIVGTIEDTGRLYGRIEFASPWTIERIGGIDANVQIQTVFQPEGPAKRYVHAELSGAGDGIAASRAPLTGKRHRVSSRAEI